MKFYTDILYALINLGVKKTDSDKLKEKKKFLNTVGLLQGFGGLMFGLICLILNFKYASFISLAYAGLITINFVYYGITRNYKLTGFVQIFLTILVPFLFHLGYGGLIPSGMIILWIMLPIVSSIAISGLKNTISWFVFVTFFFIVTLFLKNYIKQVPLNVDSTLIQLFFDLNALMIAGILIGMVIFFINKKEKANSKLENLTVSLEEIVAARTTELQDKIKALSETEEELRQNNEELISANENIEKQKKEIERIHLNLTDSLKLTGIIQGAILTRKELINSFLNEYFILYTPKDQVSGDFYYINKIKNKLFFTVADCTGHGIPGGFLTVLGISNLHEILKTNGINKPSDALSILRNRFINYELEMHIGIDIALCSIDTTTNVLQFSGANNPLIIIRDNKLSEYRANKNPVSFYFKDEDFINYEIQLQNNDVIYLFSDGYQDQFGGEANRRYSSKRFKELLLQIHNEPMDKQKTVLTNTLNEWKGNNEQIDDVTLLSIKWHI